jgi:hypothetical protein
MYVRFDYIVVVDEHSIGRKEGLMRKKREGNERMREGMRKRDGKGRVGLACWCLVGWSRWEICVVGSSSRQRQRGVHFLSLTRRGNRGRKMADSGKGDGGAWD